MRRSPASARGAALLAVILVVLVVLAGFVGFAGVVGSATGHGIDHLGVDPQGSADGVVRMESVFATEDGFVVVYRDRGGSREEVLAHRPFSASTRDVHDVPVRIPAEAWAALPRNATLRAVLHGDDGDGRFEPGTDPPLTSFGGVAGDSFVVRRGATAYVGASSGAGVQRSADGVVEVRSVRLQDRGYVVLRNSSGGVPGEVVGVTPLGAGKHTNVSVALDGVFFAAHPTNATFSVWAHVYAADGDGTFDEGDRPVRAGAETVGTRFGIKKISPRLTPTPTPDEGSIVVTATPTAPPTGSATPTPTAGLPSITHSPTATASPRPGNGGAGPGFGMAAILVALAAVALLALRRS